jgi:membrane associated rhomboid family serine protease
MRPALTKLITINVGVWFILTLIQIAGFLAHSSSIQGDQLWLDSALNWIGVPAYIPNVLLKPWTIITYMFVQESFWHLFFNMIWLFWFGKIFMEFNPGKRIYAIYIIGGIAGALTFIFSYNIFPVFDETVKLATTIGASASVLAITTATAVLVPGYTVNLLFIGSVKIKYIAIFTIILDVLMIRSGNAGGHFAHIGGAISGVLYILILKQNFRLFSSLSDLKKKFFTKKPLHKIHSQAKPLSDEEYNRQKALKQQKIDLILDKISKSGYTSLSNEEKEILFNSSKNQ